MKFKIGDHVYGKKDNGYGITNEDMEDAEVIKIKNDIFMTVKVLKHRYGEEEGNEYEVRNTSEKFGLIGSIAVNNKECAISNNNKDFNLKRIEQNDNKFTFLWSDGSYTVVTQSKDEKFNLGLAFVYAHYIRYSGLSKNKVHKFLNNLETRGQQKEREKKEKIEKQKELERKQQEEKKKKIRRMAEIEYYKTSLRKAVEEEVKKIDAENKKIVIKKVEKKVEKKEEATDSKEHKKCLYCGKINKRKLSQFCSPNCYQNYYYHKNKAIIQPKHRAYSKEYRKTHPKVSKQKVKNNEEIVQEWQDVLLANKHPDIKFRQEELRKPKTIDEIFNKIMSKRKPGRPKKEK